MCTVFQLYAMTFTGIMSIVPIEMNQPAVYFMPLTMAFVAAFVFSFYHSVTLVFVELGAYTIASYLTKSSEIFVIDLFSCILGVFLSVLVAKILFSHRARENESRQQLRRTGMIDQLTSTYNKATTEFLCREYMREHPLLPCVMMILDFDNFKTVNDTYGHQAGDVAMNSFLCLRIAGLQTLSVRRVIFRRRRDVFGHRMAVSLFPAVSVLRWDRHRTVEKNTVPAPMIRCLHVQTGHCTKLRKMARIIIGSIHKVEPFPIY